MAFFNDHSCYNANSVKKVDQSSLIISWHRLQHFTFAIWNRIEERNVLFLLGIKGRIVKIKHLWNKRIRNCYCPYHANDLHGNITVRSQSMAKKDHPVFLFGICAKPYDKFQNYFELNIIINLRIYPEEVAQYGVKLHDAQQISYFTTWCQAWYQSTL